jgi:adenylate cyclase
LLSIRYKVLIVVIPLLTVSMVLLTIVSVGLARNGITKIATEFLGYKINEIDQKASSEVANLKQSDFKNDNAFVDEVKKGIEGYAGSITKKNIESFIAVDSSGIVRLSTDSFMPVGQTVEFFYLFNADKSNWITFKVNGLDKVGFYKYFPEWDYYFLLSVYSSMFYKDANDIFNNSILILIVSIIIMLILLFLFINFILAPLKNIVSTMQDIIKLNDLNGRVPVSYNDEIGELAFTFNNMIGELQGAYTQIKEYAYQSVLAQKKEERIKVMFQKYVPQDVVNEIVSNPDQALIGKNANITVLFSDIRSFTTISESMSPENLVDSLNRYFTVMVDLIYKRRGIIDKYIGDAIMAVFGAPKVYGDDVQQAIYAGLEMLENLEVFNKQQREKNFKEFNIGIGINYGPVTVGNIGTSQKMDYTVIGDAVNLASRLEGLTKEYHTKLIISEGTYNAVKDYFYVREIDRVRVKGKLKPVRIFQPARKLTNVQKKAWTIYNTGVKLFLERSWDESEKNFIKSLNLLEEDYLSSKYLEDIKHFRIYPPDEDWDGTTTMTHK